MCVCVLCVCVCVCLCVVVVVVVVEELFKRLLEGQYEKDEWFGRMFFLTNHYFLAV